MKVDTFHVHYMIDGKPSCILTKMFYEQIDEEEFSSIHFEVVMNHYYIQSRLSGSIEYAIKFLQKELPKHIDLACCQSCTHGNFNPYGDVENKIFCLKDMTLRNREDVVKIFSEQDGNLPSRSRKLLDFCLDYKPIVDDEKYTYNDWIIEDKA